DRRGRDGSCPRGRSALTEPPGGGACGGLPHVPGMDPSVGSRGRTRARLRAGHDGPPLPDRGAQLPGRIRAAAPGDREPRLVHRRILPRETRGRPGRLGCPRTRARDAGGAPREDPGSPHRYRIPQPGSGRSGARSRGKGRRAEGADRTYRPAHPRGDPSVTAKTRPPAPRRPRRKTALAPPPTVSIETIPLVVGKKAHPAIGLGLWGLGRWTGEDEARTKATIARAYERGLRWFDSAEVYGSGRSERVLGEVLHRTSAAGTDAYIATKVSWEHLRPTQVRAALVGSLERLGRSSVDLYLIHAPDPRVPMAGTMATLETLWKEGKVGAIGVSNFSQEQLEEASR